MLKFGRFGPILSSYLCRNHQSALWQKMYVKCFPIFRRILLLLFWVENNDLSGACTLWVHYLDSNRAYPFKFAPFETSDNMRHHHTPHHVHWKYYVYYVGSYFFCYIQLRISTCYWDISSKGFLPCCCQTYKHRLI